MSEIIQTVVIGAILWVLAPTAGSNILGWIKTKLPTFTASKTPDTTSVDLAADFVTYRGKLKAQGMTDAVAAFDKIWPMIAPKDEPEAAADA